MLRKHRKTLKKCRKSSEAVTTFGKLLKYIFQTISSTVLINFKNLQKMFGISQKRLKVLISNLEKFFGSLQNCFESFRL